MVLNGLFPAVLANVLVSPFFVAFYFRKRREKPLAPSLFPLLIVFWFFLSPSPLFLNFVSCMCSFLVLDRTVMLRHFDNSLSCQIIKQGEERDLFFCKSWTMYMLQMSLAKWMFWGYSWAMYNPRFYSQIERRGNETVTWPDILLLYWKCHSFLIYPVSKYALVF